MQYCKFVIFLLLVIPTTVFSQQSSIENTDITGLWKGTMYNDTTKQYYKYEVGISKEKGKYSGFSHTYFLFEDKQYYGVKKVKIKMAEDGKIIIEDDGLIANNYPVQPNKNVRQLNVLTLDAGNSIMTLTGPFSTNRTKDYHSLTGFINLQRKNDFWQSALVPHLQELGKEKDLSFVKEEAETLALQETKQKLATEQKKKEQALAEQQLKDAALADQLAKAKQQADIKLMEEQKIMAEKQRAADELAKQEAIKQQEAEKEKARQALAKQEADAKTQAEKEKARQEFNKKQAAIALQIEKDNATKALAKQIADAKELEEKNSRELAKKQQLEKENAEKAAALIAKQQAEIKLLAEVEKNKKAAAAQRNVAAAGVSNRTTVLQQTVSFTSDSLQLSLYDNGEIDGDTVSVLMNGQLLLAKQGLSTTAIRKTIYIPSNTDRVELVMYAESLGSIPPNTGLLVIKDGKSLYEVRFSGDLQKNASIVFNRKKE